MKSLIAIILTATFCLVCMANQTAPDDDAASLDEAKNNKDLIRFSNGDTLHGLFLGFDDHAAIIWKNPEAPEPIRFSTQKIHRVVLNRGHAHKKVGLKSTITLVNGDIIPCEITSADATTISLVSSHLGNLSVPRDTVSTITNSPHGGGILYYGPLDPKGWKTLTKVEQIENNAQDAAKGSDDEVVKNPDAQNPATYWKHITNAWYSVEAKKLSYLVHENILPDKCSLSMKLAWRGKPSIHIALHADLTPPAYKGNDRLTSLTAMASMTGHAYTVRIDQYGAELFRHTYDETGKPKISRVDNYRTPLNLRNTQELQLEFRFDKPNKIILLYINEQFKAIWNIDDEYCGKGNALGFCNNRYENSTLRVSDIIISKWNGLKDSAQSMRSKQRDTILLTNGTDRFSGSFKHLKNGKVSFLGSYGNQFSIPIQDVQEIHLASDTLRKPIDEDDNKTASFHTPPYGRISGIPVKNTSSGTLISSQLLGELNLRTSYVNIIDFSHQNNLLDLWDDHF